MAKRFKLRRSDLPADRRYSRERLWVKALPSGNFRIGVALPAVQDALPGVYFAEFQTTGLLVARKRFGFIDIETGRFDLVSPVGGRVVRANPRLAEDPGLVARDCFGEGWLCELGRVLPRAVEQLLDQENFYSWLKFEREARRSGLEPLIGMTCRHVPGEAWPRDMVVRLGGRVVLRSRVVRLGRNETFTPQWTLGQTWRVRTAFDQPSMMMVADAPAVRVERLWDFKVVDDFSEVKGEMCWAVEVREAPPAPSVKHTVLHVAKSDFSLRRIDEVANHDPRLGARVPNDWGAECFLELRRPRELIVDLPLFPFECADETRLVVVGDEPRVRVEATFPDSRRMRVVMEAATRAGEPALRSEQTWVRGLPWWREARRVQGDLVLVQGELLT